MCSVCLDEMDMLEFNDPREKTDTCFKLNCGHAYHTACIIRYLSNSNHSCLHCNEVKTPIRELNVVGLAASLRAKISRHPEVQFLKREMNEAYAEYAESIKSLKAEIKQLIKTRIAETCIKEKRDYWQAAERAVNTKQREIARTMGREYIGALVETDQRYRRRRWKFWALIHPHFGMRL